MASFTTVEDSLVLDVPQKGENIAVAISGTYAMVIELRREVGSRSSGSWETLKSWSTADATVAYNHVTEKHNERLQMFLRTDTSGTAVVTLTDTTDLVEHSWADKAGNLLAELTQKFTKIYGGLVRTSASIVTVTAATILNEEDHAGRTLVVNSAAGVAITLPEATGTGNVYTIFVGTTITSVGMTIVAPSSATSFIGGVGLSTDIAGVTILANTGDDTITMSGSTTGGVLGSWVRLTDVAAGIFMLEGFLCATGAEADPFSAAV